MAEKKRNDANGKSLAHSQAGKKGGGQRKVREVPPAGSVPWSGAGVTGAPTKCTAEAIVAFSDAYALGIGPVDAARIIGVEPATVMGWFDKGTGEDAREPYRTFVERAMAAEALAVGTAADEALRKHPTWWLSRVRPQRFGSRATIEHRHSVDGDANRGVIDAIWKEVPDDEAD